MLRPVLQVTGLALTRRLDFRRTYHEEVVGKTQPQEPCRIVLKPASAVHIIQHPNTTRYFLHRQHQLLLVEREIDCRYPSRNRQAVSTKGGNAERFSDWLSFGRVKVNPNIEKPSRSETKYIVLPFGDQRGLSSQCLLGSGVRLRARGTQAGSSTRRSKLSLSARMASGYRWISERMRPRSFISGK